MNAYDRCANCHCEFADHDYIPNSIGDWKCPIPHLETGYGFYSGGDPRRFHPNVECCSPAELNNHRKACELWDEAEAKGQTPEPEKCPSGWIYDERGVAIAHVLRAPYGIGCYTAEFETYWQPADAVEPLEDDDWILL